MTTGRTRTCGGCTACCTVMGVAEIGKGSWQRCDLECGNGCAAYLSRPPSCRDYSCLWLLDPGQKVFRNMERPDRVGVVLDVTGLDHPVTERLGMQAAVAREVRPGAFEEPAARALLERIERKTLVIRLTPDGRQRLVGPEHLVRRVQR